MKERKHFKVSIFNIITLEFVIIDEFLQRLTKCKGKNPVSKREDFSYPIMTLALIFLVHYQLSVSQHLSIFSERPIIDKQMMICFAFFFSYLLSVME